MVDLTSWPNPTAIVLSSVIGVLGGFGVAVSSRIGASIGRNHSKRLDLHEQRLELELSASKRNVGAQDEVMRTAQIGIQRVFTDADQFMSRLEWKSLITRSLWKEITARHGERRNIAGGAGVRLAGIPDCEAKISAFE